MILSLEQKWHGEKAGKNVLQAAQIRDAHLVSNYRPSTFFCGIAENCGENLSRKPAERQAVGKMRLAALFSPTPEPAR